MESTSSRFLQDTKHKIAARQ